MQDFWNLDGLLLPFGSNRFPNATYTYARTKQFHFSSINQYIGIGYPQIGSGLCHKSNQMGQKNRAPNRTGIDSKALICSVKWTERPTRSPCASQPSLESPWHGLRLDNLWLLAVMPSEVKCFVQKNKTDVTGKSLVAFAGLCSYWQEAQSVLAKRQEDGQKKNGQPFPYQNRQSVRITGQWIEYPAFGGQWVACIIKL